MLKVYNCIVGQHDLRLVALAALVCALASFTAINLLHHVRRTEGAMRAIWLAVAATSTGFGVWATHFIAMLAFSPGIPYGYDVPLTAISLIAAILLTGLGFAIALTRSLPGGPWIGGATVGGGIAAMHYTGMAAFEVSGWIVWDPTLVAASLLLGAFIGGAALWAGLREDSLTWRLLGAILLVAAICSLHFTAMAAVSIIPDGAMDVPPNALPASWLAIAVAWRAWRSCCSPVADLRSTCAIDGAPSARRTTCGASRTRRSRV